MSNPAEEIKTQIETINEQVKNGDITKEDGCLLLEELRDTLDALDEVYKEIAVRYVFAAFKTLGR